MAVSMCCAPMIRKSANTASFTPTMMLFARVLSLTPVSNNQVISATIAKAGTFTRTGIPNSLGAVCISPCTAGSELNSAVR